MDAMSARILTDFECELTRRHVAPRVTDCFVNRFGDRVQMVWGPKNSASGRRKLSTVVIEPSGFDVDGMGHLSCEPPRFPGEFLGTTAEKSCDPFLTVDRLSA